MEIYRKRPETQIKPILALFPVAGIGVPKQGNSVKTGLKWAL